MTKEMTESKKLDMAIGIDFGDDLGGGMEGADRESFAIPFLKVLQKLSPQCDEADAAFVQGAKGGMLFNSVTGELFADGVTFLPCAYQRRFLRWGPRGDGGGFKGELLPEDVARLRDNDQVRDLDGRLYFPDESGAVNDKRCDRLVDTRSHFGIIINGENLEQVLLPLSSTQIKKSKQLMSMLSAVKIKGPKGMITPPTWMNKVKITTTLESNDQGSWYGVKFELDGFINTQEVYDVAKTFHDTVMQGETKVNYQETAEGKF